VTDFCSLSSIFEVYRPISFRHLVEAPRTACGMPCVLQTTLGPNNSTADYRAPPSRKLCERLKGVLIRTHVGRGDRPHFRSCCCLVGPASSASELHCATDASTSTMPAISVWPNFCPTACTVAVAIKDGRAWFSSFATSRCLFVRPFKLDHMHIYNLQWLACHFRLV
jgi:hypothetical protein